MDFDNIGEIKELLKLGDDFSDGVITSNLNKNITIQAIVDDGEDEDVFPLIKLPVWTVVEAYKDIARFEKGECTESEAKDTFIKRFNDLIDVGIVEICI